MRPTTERAVHTCQDDAPLVRVRASGICIPDRSVVNFGIFCYFPRPVTLGAIKRKSVEASMLYWNRTRTMYKDKCQQKKNKAEREIEREISGIS